MVRGSPSNGKQCRRTLQLCALLPMAPDTDVVERGFSHCRGTVHSDRHPAVALILFWMCLFQYISQVREIMWDRRTY